MIFLPKFYRGCYKIICLGGRQILISVRMLSFEMSSEMEIALLLAALLGLCLHYLHENRENNRIISAGGLEEWVVDGF